MTETDGIIVKIFTEDYDLSAMFEVFLTRVFWGERVWPVCVCGRGGSCFIALSPLPPFPHTHSYHFFQVIIVGLECVGGGAWVRG